MDDDIRQHLERQQYAEAFELLLQRFKDRVFRLAFSFLRNQTQAEDAAQDAFVRIWKGLPGFHGDASLSTWIYTITRNTCLSELNKRAARPTISLQDPEMEEVADRMTAAQSNSAQPGSEMDLDAMLTALPEKSRRVVILFYLEQKSYEEVAAMLGIPLGTVKTLLFRAKKELLNIGARHERLSSTARNRSDSMLTLDPTGSPRQIGTARPTLITPILI
jgi:RNA polymerase sigma-70 factor, ECF subfamily